MKLCERNLNIETTGLSTARAVYFFYEGHSYRVVNFGGVTSPAVTVNISMLRDEDGIKGSSHMRHFRHKHTKLSDDIIYNISDIFASILWFQAV